MIDLRRFVEQHNLKDYAHQRDSRGVVISLVAGWKSRLNAVRQSPDSGASRTKSGRYLTATPNITAIEG